MLVAFPAAYLFGSALVDAWATAADRRDWSRTAHHLNTLGIASAVVAALPGVVDYLLAIPPKSSARTRATDHMIANLSALALFGVARAGRGRGDDPARWWAVAAEICGAGLITVAGWLGGTLVYRNQIGVDHRYANASTWQPIAAAPVDSGAVMVDASVVDDMKIDQLRLLNAGGERMALARTEHGVCAISDRCTHRGGPLSDGVLVCGVVQCPWHGSQFDVTTGAVMQGPAAEPVETFAVDRADGTVRVGRR
jgi:nitrite reductase/ring-hydroxylating ferredoxin subunit/uncharacterized membrane protein